MTFCDILVSIATGLVTGAVSSLIATGIWQRREEKNNYIKDFKNDIQLLCGYLNELTLELNLFNESNNTDNILRQVEAFPRTLHLFDQMTEQGQKYMLNISKTIREIRTDAEKNVLKAKVLKYKSQIFRSEIDLLKNQSTIQKPWSETHPTIFRKLKRIIKNLINRERKN